MMNNEEDLTEKEPLCPYCQSKLEILYNDEMSRMKWCRCKKCKIKVRISGGFIPFL